MPFVLPSTGEFALEIVGQIGGSSRALALQAPYVYLGLGPRMVVVDVADPLAPRIVGWSPVLGLCVEGVAVEGKRAYVTTGALGLHVLDLADPTSPRLLGACDTPGFARALAIHGGVACVADGDAGLAVVDVSDPSAPWLAGSADTPGNACAVVIVGKYAYVADSDATTERGGLQVIDISDPAAPRVVGAVRTGDARGISVQGHYAYLTAHALETYGHGELRVIDVADPTNPSQAVAFQPLVSGKFSDIAVAGSYAYVRYGVGELGSWRENWFVVDIARAAALPDAGGSGQPGGAAGRGIAIGEGLAYVAGGRGLEIWQLRPGGGRAWLAATGGLGSVDYVAVADDHAYLILDAQRLGGSRLATVDVRDPALPVLQSTLPLTTHCRACVSLPTCITAADGYAYVGLTDDGLQIVDVTEPTAPRLRGHLEMDKVASVTAAGRYLYLASKQTLHVVDVTNPDQPRLTGAVRDLVPSADSAVVVAGQSGYVIAGRAGQPGNTLQVIDLANPARPQLKGKLEVDYATELEVDAGYAYVTSMRREDGTFGPSCTSELWVIDVSDPMQPRRAGIWGTMPGCEYRLAAAGGYAYLAGRIIDARNAGQPQEVGTYDSRGRAVVAVGDLIYAASSDGGLLILRRVPTARE